MDGFWCFICKLSYKKTLRYLKGLLKQILFSKYYTIVFTFITWSSVDFLPFQIIHFYG